MTDSDTQRLVAAFTRDHGLEIAPDLRLLDLVSEVGELAKERLSGSGYGAKPFTPGERWADELGDVAFALCCLATDTGVDLREATLRSIEKHAARIAANGRVSST